MSRWLLKCPERSLLTGQVTVCCTGCRCLFPRCNYDLVWCPHQNHISQHNWPSAEPSVYWYGAVIPLRNTICSMSLFIQSSCFSYTHNGMKLLLKKKRCDAFFKALDWKIRSGEYVKWNPPTYAESSEKHSCWSLRCCAEADWDCSMIQSQGHQGKRTGRKHPDYSSGRWNVD